jgi:cysteine desulfurase
MSIIFLDHNSTTKISDEVINKMLEVYQMPLNSSAIHQLGRRANFLIEEANNYIKKLLNADNYEIIYTSSSTEATNTVFFGTDSNDILFSKIEHASVYNCRPNNKRIHEINVQKNGLIDKEDLKNKIPKNKTFLVSAMLANNETGAIQNVEEISKLTHQNFGLIHCDLVQAIGKINVDIEKINPDYAVISAHKINGPQGVGALLIRKGLDIKPLIHGSKQQKSKRAGTMNIAGIAGFGEACNQAKKNLEKYHEISKLRNYLEDSLKNIAGENLKIFCSEVNRLANTSFIALKNIDSQTQLINFDLNGICVSSGSACSSGSLDQSRVLKAMGVSDEFLKGAIRISLGHENSISDVNKFIQVWHEFYKKFY